MKGNKLLIIAMAVIASLLTLKIFAAATDSPVGYWQTVDDKTGKVLSIVQIYSAGNTLQGRIVKIMPVLGQKSTDICVKCKGELRGRPMLNLPVIYGMQQVGANAWSRGHVLDPKSGNIYSGTMTLIDNGNRLKLRGYVINPLFGRSETWVRAGR